MLLVGKDKAEEQSTKRYQEEMINSNPAVATPSNSNSVQGGERSKRPLQESAVLSYMCPDVDSLKKLLKSSSTNFGRGRGQVQVVTAQQKHSSSLHQGLTWLGPGHKGYAKPRAEIGYCPPPLFQPHCHLIGVNGEPSNDATVITHLECSASVSTILPNSKREPNVIGYL